MQVMQALRRATCTPEKLDACVDLIPGPCVIFTWYRETAKRIHGAIQKSGRTSVCLDGDVPVQERVRLAKSNEYVVATIESLSEGCDLTHTKAVIFVEEFYTPGMMKQAMSRVRRFTENHGPVMVWYLHMDNSIDEIIHNRQKDRAATAEAIVKEALDD
jgi:superfamily II DNA or RNA helicase